MDDTSAGGSDGAFIEVATEKLTILNQDILIARTGPSVLIAYLLKVDLR